MDLLQEVRAPKILTPIPPEGGVDADERQKRSYTTLLWSRAAMYYLTSLYVIVWSLATAMTHSTTASKLWLLIGVVIALSPVWLHVLAIITYNAKQYLASRLLVYAQLTPLILLLLVYFGLSST